jgi:hypothetical protein
MKKLLRLAALVAPLAITPALAQAPAAPAPATNVVEKSSDYRFQMDYQVNQAALNKMLPAGWESAVAAQGPAKDCNIRLIFVERSNIVGPDNRVLGKGKDMLAFIEAPVRQTGGTVTGRMILAGISANNPGGAMLAARTANVSRSRTVQNENAMVTEDWEFVGAGGERLQLHVQYRPAPTNVGAGETRFFDPADPGKVQLWRTETATDIARNVTTTPPDRVTQFSYRVSGGKFAALFDGSEKALSWDAQPVYSRTVVQP